MQLLQVIGWIAVVGAWVVTTFINGEEPQALRVGYAVLVIVGLVAGITRLVKRRDIALFIVAVLTVFSWPILLMIAIWFGAI